MYITFSIKLPLRGKLRKESKTTLFIGTLKDSEVVSSIIISLFHF